MFADHWAMDAAMHPLRPLAGHKICSVQMKYKSIASYSFNSNFFLVNLKLAWQFSTGNVTRNWSFSLRLAHWSAAASHHWEFPNDSQTFPLGANLWTSWCYTRCADALQSRKTIKTITRNVLFTLRLKSPNNSVFPGWYTVWLILAYVIEWHVE